MNDTEITVAGPFKIYLTEGAVKSYGRNYMLTVNDRLAWVQGRAAGTKEGATSFDATINDIVCIIPTVSVWYIDCTP